MLLANVLQTKKSREYLDIFINRISDDGSRRPGVFDHWVTLPDHA